MYHSKLKNKRLKIFPVNKLPSETNHLYELEFKKNTRKAHEESEVKIKFSSSNATRISLHFDRENLI